jgi:hypothetical protein
MGPSVVAHPLVKLEGHGIHERFRRFGSEDSAVLPVRRETG